MGWNSPPLPVCHATPFEEKSGGDSVCAVATVANAATIATPPFRSISLEMDLDILTLLFLSFCFSFGIIHHHHHRQLLLARPPRGPLSARNRHSSWDCRGSAHAEQPRASAAA